MATEVVNSYNWFLDTERCVPSAATGDDTSFPLSSTPITCADNQHIRLTLQSFSCYKNFYNVNPNNNKFRVILPSGTPGNQIPPVDYQGINYLTIPQGDYASRHDIALVFTRTVARFLQLAFTRDFAGGGTLDEGVVPGNILPSVNTDAGTSQDNIYYGEILWNGTWPPSSAAWLPEYIVIQANVADGDFFELLGVNRVTDPNDITTSSFAIDRGTNGALGPADDGTIKIAGLYPMQLTTQQNIYVRTNLTNTNIETESYDAGSTDVLNAQMQSSPILGKIIIDNEFCVFTAQTQLEYFVNVAGRQLAFCRLYLTDSHGREIPSGVRRVECPILDQTTKWDTLTAPNDYLSIEPLLNNQKDIGYSPSPINQNKQKTLGNFSYEGVIKIDIVQYLGGQNNVLQSQLPVKTIPARFGSEPLNNLDYGKSGYPDETYGKPKRIK
jgi:hypothetical protein